MTANTARSTAPAEPGGGEQQARHGRAGVTVRVGEDKGSAVEDGEGEHDVPNQTMERHRLVDRQQSSEPARSNAREEPAHHWDEDERSIEVDAPTERPANLHYRVGRGTEEPCREECDVGGNPDCDEDCRPQVALGAGPRTRCERRRPGPLGPRLARSTSPRCASSAQELLLLPDDGLEFLS